VASLNLVRLSLKKAAYVAVDWCSVVGNPEFARDDKLKGGGPPWQWWRWRDRVKQQGPHTYQKANLDKYDSQPALRDSILNERLALEVLLSYPVQTFFVRLFGKKSRTSLNSAAQSRSENALVSS
jgi:hypothetical protein